MTAASNSGAAAYDCAGSGDDYGDFSIDLLGYPRRGVR
jgi:hypothetical protein